jgi:acetoin utilization protein AcuB
MLRVGDVMTTRLVRVCADDSLQDALRTMEVHGVRHLLVYEGERLVGMASDRDLWFAHPSRVCESQAEVEQGLRAIHVRQAMTPMPLVSVAPPTSCAEAAACMLDHHVSALLVVEGGRAVGIVSSTDLVAILAGRRGGRDAVGTEH